MTVGALTGLNGFVPFGANSLWNTTFRRRRWIPTRRTSFNFIGSTVTIHADFGSGMVQHQTLGIPYQVVAGTASQGVGHSGNIFR